MTDIFTTQPDGRRTWKQQPGDYYLLTGVTDRGSRYSRTGPYEFLCGFHPAKGSRWLVRDGKRHLIERISN